MSQGVSPWSRTGVTLRWFCLDVAMMTLVTWYHPHHNIAMACMMTCCQLQTWDKDRNKWQHLHHEDLGLDHNCHKDIMLRIVFSSKTSASSSVHSIQVMYRHFLLTALHKIQYNGFRPNLNQNTWRPFRPQVSSSYGAPPCGSCGSGSSGGSGSYVPPTHPRPSYEAPNSFVTPVRPISVINPIKPSIGFRLVGH